MERFMSDEELKQCKDWIHKHLSEHPRNTADSYILKHMFQHMTGIYSSNDEFKDVLRSCGFDSCGKRDSQFNLRIDSVVINNYYYKGDNKRKNP